MRTSNQSRCGNPKMHVCAHPTHRGVETYSHVWLNRQTCAATAVGCTGTRLRSRLLFLCFRLLYIRQLECGPCERISSAAMRRKLLTIRQLECEPSAPISSATIPRQRLTHDQLFALDHILDIGNKRDSDEFCGGHIILP